MSKYTWITNWLDTHQTEFSRMADAIWEKPEPAFQEFFASKTQADYLAAKGFSIRWDVGEMSTAFIAEWGRGRPLIGFAGEYDALPALSQSRALHPDPISIGAAGHGCGHNLLGTGAVAAAAALQAWAQDQDIPVTIRYYGCPAEEEGSGKTYMARAGAFDDLDVAFNFHPGYTNYAAKGTTLSVNEARFRFHGRAAHAAAVPHLGRSALDAVELLNIGVNFLREHVPPDVRIHYVISDGGGAPNVVPETAEAWYFIRAHMPSDLQTVTERVRKIAEGAALMTETRLEENFEAGLSSLLSNLQLADLQYEIMQELGPISWTDAEIAAAEAINAFYPPEVKDGIAAGFSFDRSLLDPALTSEPHPAMDTDVILPASTDVGDLSWKAPVSMLFTTCMPSAAMNHSWGVVSAVGSSIGHKGMLYAAQVMSLSAAHLLQDPARLAAVRAEFEAKRARHNYQPPVADDKHPPQYSHPLR